VPARAAAALSSARNAPVAPEICVYCIARRVQKKASDRGNREAFEFIAGRKGIVLQRPLPAAPDDQLTAIGAAR
jgi:hypothetical protein